MHVRQFASLILWGALLLPNPLFAPAQDTASARTFLNSVFDLYGNHGKGIQYNPRFLHSTLLVLIHEDLKAANAASEVPWPLDADIVCDCQEWEGIWVRKLDIKLEEPGRARVIVTFDFETPENRADTDIRSMRYTLVAERGQWRIYDIEDLSRTLEANEPRSLRKQIQKDIESFKHESR